jgi:ubiquinone/menaquinone biosynthesis C-methylase UbiE
VGALQRAYFDHVYNPLYDATTATLNRYRMLQARCIRMLELQSSRSILCVGMGTGNEAVTILAAAPHIEVSGIDLSASALAASRRKLRRIGRQADLRRMDAASLQFADGSFDRALCLHVLDFVEDAGRVIREVLRVLRPGGRVVLTLPSRPDGPLLEAGLARDHVQSALRSGTHPLRVLAEVILRFSMSLVYAPLAMRPRGASFTIPRVHRLLAGLSIRSVAIEEEPAYQDLIVSIVKSE